MADDGTLGIVRDRYYTSWNAYYAFLMKLQLSDNYIKILYMENERGVVQDGENFEKKNKQIEGRWKPTHWSTSSIRAVNL